MFPGCESTKTFICFNIILGAEEYEIHCSTQRIWHVTVEAPWEKQGALTIYTENPEILVGKLNGTYHSIWDISEIIGYRLNQCIFSFPFELSNGY